MASDIPRLFGTDGVRGTVGKYPMTSDVIRDLAGAIARYFITKRNIRTLIIIRDTRKSGAMLELALSDGLTAHGCNVVLAGVLPTGAAGYLAMMHNHGAIVISASHNPASDNGIKIFTEDGFKLSEADERLIEKLLAESHKLPDISSGESTVHVSHDESLKDDYLAFLAEQASDAVKAFLEKNRIVLDCANGSASTVAPALFRSLSNSKDSVITLFAEPDGKNINKGCGSQHIEPLQQAVREHSASLGFAFDGDADRLIVVDETGAVLNGDRVMAVLATWLLDQDKLSSNTVVATVYTNLGLRTFLEKIGCSLEIVPNGDRFVTRKMLEFGLSLGGEQSGHIVLMPPATTGDGLLTALALLGAVSESRQPLSALHAGFEECPQSLLNVPVREKRDLKTLKGVQAVISEAEKALADSGRVIVRYSGTENLCRVLVESLSEEEARRWAEKIAGAIKKEVGMDESHET